MSTQLDMFAPARELPLFAPSDTAAAFARVADDLAASERHDTAAFRIRLAARLVAAGYVEEAATLLAISIQGTSRYARSLRQHECRTNEEAAATYTEAGLAYWQVLRLLRALRPWPVRETALVEWDEPVPGGAGRRIALWRHDVPEGTEPWTGGSVDVCRYQRGPGLRVEVQVCMPGSREQINAVRRVAPERARSVAERWARMAEAALEVGA